MHPNADEIVQMNTIFLRSLYLRENFIKTRNLTLASMLREVHLKQKRNIKPKPEKKTRKTALRHALRGHGIHQKKSLNSFLFVFNEYSLRYDLLTYC